MVDGDGTETAVGRSVVSCPPPTSPHPPRHTPSSSGTRPMLAMTNILVLGAPARRAPLMHPRLVRLRRGVRRRRFLRVLSPGSSPIVPPPRDVLPQARDAVGLLPPAPTRRSTAHRRAGSLACDDHADHGGKLPGEAARAPSSARRPWRGADASAAGPIGMPAISRLMNAVSGSRTASTNLVSRLHSGGDAASPHLLRRTTSAAAPSDNNSDGTTGSGAPTNSAP